MERAAITRTAFHEAAHFLALWEAGHSPRLASVVPGIGGRGRVDFEKNPVITRNEAVAFLCCMMAGPAAEQKIAGLPADQTTIASLDAFHIAKTLNEYCHSDRKKMVRQANSLTIRWLDANWHRIDRLARHLQNWKELTADEVKRDLPDLLTPKTN